MWLIERLMASWGKTANLEHIVKFFTFEGFGERFNQQRIWLQSWLNFGQNSTKSLDFQKHFTGNLRAFRMDFNTDINLKFVMDTEGIVSKPWYCQNLLVGSRLQFQNKSFLALDLSGWPPLRSSYSSGLTTNFSNCCVWSVKVVVPQWQVPAPMKMVVIWGH